MTAQHEPQEGQPLGALVHQLSQQIPELIRSEMRLAQAEVAQKGKRAGVGIGMFSIAGLLGFFAVASLVTTAILGLTYVVDPWLAALIVAVVLLVAAALVGVVGKNKVAEAGPQFPSERCRASRTTSPPSRETTMTDPRTPEQIEADIAHQREQLADTVDQLAAKLDVKAQARARVHTLQDRATTDSGSPRPEVLAAAGSLLAMAVVLVVWRIRRTH